MSAHSRKDIDTHEQLQPSKQLESAVDALLKAVGPLGYGSIELTFHQGRIVQIEKREKTRLSGSLV